MLNELKFDFKPLLIRLIQSSDYRTNHIGVWLLRGCADACDRFREDAMDASLFIVRKSNIDSINTQLYVCMFYQYIAIYVIYVFCASYIKIKL